MERRFANLPGYDARLVRHLQQNTHQYLICCTVNTCSGPMLGPENLLQNIIPGS